MSTKPTPTSDKDLWQSFAADGPVAPSAVSDMDFAAWLEGRLPETTAARIELAVATDPALREAALELAEILGRPLPVPPPRMAVRAQALVGFAVERAPRKSWLSSLLPDFGQGFGLQRGAFAAMAVMVAAVGFTLGGGLSEHFDDAHYAAYKPATGPIARPLGRDTSSELNDLFTDAT